MITYEGIDHVQLAAPPGCEPLARAFYVEALGLVELPKPASMAARGGCWFQCGAQQIHVGVEADFRPAKKAHPALRLADRASFDALEDRLASKGVAIKRDGEIGGVARFFADDPWGNRLELLVGYPDAERP